MKRVIIYIGIFITVTAILVYQVTNPVQSEIIITNKSNQNNASVSFDIQNKSFVKLTLYDFAGKEVSSLINEELQAGLHKVSLQDEMANGGYFYKLTAENPVIVTKIDLDKSSQTELSYK